MSAALQRLSPEAGSPLEDAATHYYAAMASRRRLFAPQHVEVTDLESAQTASRAQMCRLAPRPLPSGPYNCQDLFHVLESIPNGQALPHLVALSGVASKPPPPVS